MWTTARAISICNIALGKVGQSNIKAFDKSVRGEACETSFPNCLGTALEASSFEFSKKTATLVKYADRNGYQIPAQMINALGLRDTCGCCEECESFHLNSDVGLIITDNSLFINKPVACSCCGCGCDVLVYTSGELDKLAGSSMFDRMVAILLAMDLALIFPVSEVLKNDLFAEYRYWEAKAKARQNTNHDRTGDDSAGGCRVPYFKNRRGFLL